MAGGEAFGVGENRTVRLAQGLEGSRVEAGAPSPGGEASPRPSSADLSILLDVIDGMPADMLSNCRDEMLPEERDGL